MFKKDDIEGIKVLVGPVIRSLGMELVDIEFAKGGPKWYLRLFIDKEGGVTLDDCEQVSYHVGEVLDVEDIISHSYILEVSSPGLDRPIKRLEDYDRFKGKLVKIKTYEPIEGGKVFIGRIVGTEGNIVKISEEVKGIIKGIPSEKIASARLVMEI